MNIVILSRNKDLYSTRRLVEEAEYRNHLVEVIDPLSCDLIIEKEKPTIFYNNCSCINLNKGGIGNILSFTICKLSIKCKIFVCAPPEQ